MFCPKPCEIFKIRDKRNLGNTIRYSAGLYNDYILKKGYIFLGITNIEDKAWATTKVLNIIDVEYSGTIIFETKNSVYWMVPIDIRVVPHLLADA